MARNKRVQKAPNPSSGPNQAEKLLGYAFGLVFIITLLILAICFPEPTAFQYVVFRIVLSLAAAGIASMIPGFIEVNIPNIVRAGGTLAVFVLVYFYNPAALVVEQQDLSGTENNHWVQEIESLRGDLNMLESSWERLDEGEAPCQKIRNEASHLGDRFHEVPDTELEEYIGAKIAKYHYSQYAYLIASDVECNEEQAKNYAESSMRDRDSALRLVNIVKPMANKDGENLRNWLSKQHIVNRIYFHSAIVHALLYRHGFSTLPETLQEVNRALNKVEQRYYSEEGINLKNNPFLQPLLEGTHPINQEIRLPHRCPSMCGLK